jgi:hypothetical protein
MSPIKLSTATAPDTQMTHRIDFTAATSCELLARA